MGKDFIKLDTWRPSFTDKKGEEYTIIAGKKIYIKDLINYVNVHNVGFDEAIKEWFASKGKARWKSIQSL